MYIFFFKSAVQPVWEFKCLYVVILYLAFFMLSGFFTVDVAFLTHDNLATLSSMLLRMLWEQR